MRKLVLAMMTTLNGRLDDPDAWMTDVTDDLYADIDQAYRTFDTILIGQTTYDEMSAYWPGAETEEGSSDINRRMAHKMNTYKKYVFSRRDEKRELAWTNAERVVAPSDEDLRNVITDLKARSGQDLHLAGGAQFAQSVARLGLVDEYRFFVHPVVSAGATWFGQQPTKLAMDLLSATTFANGVVGLSYRPKHR